MKRTAMTRLISLAAAVLALLPAAALAVNIGTLHCNDANGVVLNMNSVVTVRGNLTATYPTSTSNRVYIQDGTGGINVFGLPQMCSLAIGDDIEVTGTLIHFSGLAEVASTTTPLLNLVITLNSSGNPMPAPIVLTPAQVEATYQVGDNCEPNESSLVKVNNVLVRTSAGAVPTGNYTAQTNYRLISAGPDSTTNFCTMRIIQSTNPCNTLNPIVGQKIIASCPLNITGILQQNDTTSPYTAFYQVTPRLVTDLEYLPGCTVAVEKTTWGDVKGLYRD